MMMEMNHESHSNAESESMSMMNHDDSKNEEHCDMLKNSSVLAAVIHTISDCHCIDSREVLDHSIVLPAKTSIFVVERDVLDFESIFVDAKSLQQEIDNFKPDPSPPDLFISFESLLI